MSQLDPPKSIKKSQFKIAIASETLNDGQTLKSMVEKTGCFDVLEGVKNGRDFLDLARNHSFDIGVVGWSLPDMTALDILFELKRHQLGSAVLIYTSELGDEDLWKSVKLGLRGFISPRDEEKRVIDTITAVADGRLALPYLDIGLLTRDPLDRLTQRERELLFALSNDWTSQDITSRLGISRNTVKYHLKNLYGKLGVKSRGMALALCRERLNSKELTQLIRSNSSTESLHYVDGPLGERSLLIVEDDAIYAQRLSRAMEARGFSCQVAGTVEAATRLIRDDPPAYAVVDMRLYKGNSLNVIATLTRVRPNARAVVLTGFGNFANTVSAMKLGAFDYLAKPAGPDQIVATLLGTHRATSEPEDKIMSANRVKWEHVQRIHELCRYNVSETARRLSMHRRTLQRILMKHAPK